ncbi:hypothetical protein [Vibrio sp. 10N.261.52.A1]|uniref:hypothetical protein n=1 Tax=Vibrio TaxID=662 RepID=UPI000C863BF3|nr:hypothetical protein [Vibrio sp. 10N.261.52.A1]PML64745.1 hypothetical protein BCT81_06765 [Vibrio sp. 10N.261.52.A1]
MSQTITVYSSNYHHGSKSDGVSSDDLEPHISNNYADALGYIFDYVKQRIIHSCPDLFVEEQLERPSMNCDELKVVLDEASQDQQENYCDWYFEMENESLTTASYCIKEHSITLP